MGARWYLLYCTIRERFVFAARAVHPSQVCAHPGVAAADERELSAWVAIEGEDDPRRWLGAPRYHVYAACGVLERGAPGTLTEAALARLDARGGDLDYVGPYTFDPSVLYPGDAGRFAGGTGENGAFEGDQLTEQELSQLHDALGAAMLDTLGAPVEVDVEAVVRLELEGEAAWSVSPPAPDRSFAAPHLPELDERQMQHVEPPGVDPSVKS